jgi:hypothetical protein
MAGTNLLPALQRVIESSESSLNTEVITLTDGEVWDTDSLFEFVQERDPQGQKQTLGSSVLVLGARSPIVSSQELVYTAVDWQKSYQQTLQEIGCRE